MKRRNKKHLLSTLALVGCLAVAGGVVFSVNGANRVSGSAETTTAVPSFTMSYGASVRVGNVSNATQNGIRFTAEMSAAYYDAALLLNDVSFGVMIMPQEYEDLYGALTEASVVKSGVYDWVALDGEREYNDSSKTMIANVEYRTLEKDSVGDNVYYLRGSLGGIKDANLDREFIGRAYVKYKVGDAYEYDFADWANGDVLDNTRTVTYIAGEALKDEASGLSDAQNKYLQENYIDNADAQFKEIASVADFLAMEGTGKYKLVADIDFGGASYSSNAGKGMLTTAATFSGVLDGNGHAVKNITFAGQDEQSIFGTLTGTIRNISFENIIFKGWKDENSVVYTTVRSAPIYMMHSGATVDNASFDVKFEAVSDAYTNDGSESGLSYWDSNINAGVVSNFYQGTISNSTVTIETPNNHSQKDGVAAISAIKYYKNIMDQGKISPVISDVKVYAKSSNIDYFPIYAFELGLPTVKNVSMIVSGSGEEGGATGGSGLLGEPLWTEVEKKAWSVISLNPFGLSGTVNTTDLADEMSSRSTIATTVWGTVYPFVNVDMNAYSELKFWAKGTSTGAWFECTLPGGATIAENPTTWREFRFVNNGDGTWDIYYNGELKSDNVALTNLTNDDFAMTFGSQNVYFSELFGYGDKVVEKSLAENPFGWTESVTKETIAGKEFSVMTKTMTWNAYNFLSVDISNYAYVRFYVKSEQGGWFGVMSGGTVINETDGKDWKEIRLVNNGADWSVLYNNMFQATVTLPNGNLTDLNFRFGDNTYSVTELVVNAEISPVYEEVTENPFDISGKVISEDIADEISDGSTVISATWSNSNHKFVAVENLDWYQELKFYVKSTGYFEMYNVGKTATYYADFAQNWTEVKFVKGASAWTVYVGGVDKGEISLTNLADDFQLELGKNTVTVSELFGVIQEGVYSPYVTVMQNPTQIPGEVIEEKVNAHANGVVKVEKGYGFYPFTEINLKPYKALTFWVKMSNNTYFGIVNANNTVYNENQYTSWTQVLFEKASDGTWSISYAGTVYESGITASVMSELAKFKIGGSETGTFYFTKLLGLEDESYVSDYLSISDNPFGLGGTVSEKPGDLASAYDTDKTTVATTAWTGTGHPFVSVDVNSYAEIKFYIKSTGWFEMYSADETVTYYSNVTADWLEVKFVKGASAWTVYVGGENKGEISLTNLADDFKVQLGGNTVTVSNLVGIHDKDYAPIVENGASEYSIVYAANDSDIVELAAEELQTFLYKATGAKLALKQWYGEYTPNAGNKHLVLGSLAESYGFDGLTTDTGYKLVKGGKSFYLYGETSFGTLNAVYAFLEKSVGLKFYSPEVYSFDEKTTLAYKDAWTDVSYNPDIEYNWSNDGSLLNSTFDQNIVNSARMGFVYNAAVSSFGWHNFTTILTQEKYEHNEGWFVTGTDANGSTQYTTLNIADEDKREEIAMAMARELAKAIEADEEEKIFYGLSAPDVYGGSDEAAKSLKTDNYMAFMNLVAEILDKNYLFNRSIHLMALAYHDTLNASTVGLYQGTDVTLGIMFAPAEASIYRPITDDKNVITGTKVTNSVYAAEFQKWKELGGEMYYWKYSTYTDSYFMPLDTLASMQSDYQYAYNNGVSLIYDMGQYNTPVSTDWGALKTYLKGQLAKDVDANVATLIEEFCDVYYGEASAYMQTLLQAERDWYVTLAERTQQVNSYETVGVMNGASWITDGGYWDVDAKHTIFGDYYRGGDSSMLKSWYSNITSALNATSDAEIQKRIQIESLALRYLCLKSYNVALVSGDTFEELATLAKELGITMFGEAQEIDALAQQTTVAK